MPPRAARLRGVARGRGRAPGERGARGARAVPRRSARRRRRRAVRRRRRSAGSRSCGSPPPSSRSTPTSPPGRHHELVGEIDALLAENPLRERLHAQRMLALYRCGRQAEALEAYRHARATLVEEIGVEPSAELRRLHEAILRQDPSLDVEPAAAELPRELDATAVAAADRPRRRAAPAARPLAARGGGRRARWSRSSARYGMGKTRLAAELAGEAHREGATVLYAAGTGPPEAALAVARPRARARGGRRCSWSTTPTARPPRCAPRCASSAGARRRARAGARHRAAGGGARAARAARVGRARAARRRRRAGDRRLLRAGRRRRRDPGRRRCSPTSGGVAAPRPRGGERVGAARGDAPRRRRRRPHGGRPQRGARARGRAGRQRRRAAVGARARRPRRAATATTTLRRSVCPYKGLATFDADDAEYFFGRERLVAELVARARRRAAARRSSARRAAASRRSCGPGCCPRSPAACCRAARTGRRR